jgi:hypothetical protein
MTELEGQKPLGVLVTRRQVKDIANDDDNDEPYNYDNYYIAVMLQSISEAEMNDDNK